MHAAAANASILEDDRLYKSLDGDVGCEEQLFQDYGLPIPEQINGSRLVQQNNVGGFFEENELAEDDQALSEDYHYNRHVRRNNFVELWLNEFAADEFVATHLYGAILDVSTGDIQ